MPLIKGTKQSCIDRKPNMAPNPRIAYSTNRFPHLRREWDYSKDFLQGRNSLGWWSLLIADILDDFYN